MLKKYATLAIIDAWEGSDTNRRTAHRARFNYEPQPGFIYVRSRAISSRTNDNYDNFPAEEIAKSWRTFIGKPVFVNHHNDDPSRARGVIIDAALHEDVLADGQPDTWVEVLMEVDAVRFPALAKAVIAGEIDRTSMGTNVEYSECSVCANRAYTPLEYCRHIPAMKGQKVRRTTASGTQEEVLCYEKCYGLAFFENSLLVEDPADPTAVAYEVDTRGLDMAEFTATNNTTTTVSPVSWTNLEPKDYFARVASKTGYGETKAPKSIDTIRADQCPICGETTGFNGDECGVCGYLAPPNEFRDPDLDKAQQVDLHQVEEESELDDGVTQVESEEVGLGDVPFQELPKTDEEREPAQPNGRVDQVGDVDGEIIGTDEEQAGEISDDTEEVEEPTLEEEPVEDEAPVEGDSASLEEESEEDEDDEESDDEPPFDLQDEDERRNKEKKMKQSLKAIATLTRQAQAARIMEEANAAAIQRIARLAGVKVDDIYGTARRRVANLRVTADEDNPAQPVPSPASEGPSDSTEETLGDLGAPDSVEEVGSTSETDVAADSTDSVDNVGTSIPAQPAEQVEVTAPVAGTEDQRPLDEVKITPDPTARGLDTETAFPMEDGFQERMTTGKARSFAALRLARLQIEAGVADGQDDIIVAEAIDNSDMTDKEIQGHINTLSKVVAKNRNKAQAQGRRQAARAPQMRATPSLAGGTTASAPASSGIDEDSFALL